MYSQYNEYIRSLLGYAPTNSYNNCQDFRNENLNNNIGYSNYITADNSELEKCYPEIYKIVYPMIIKKCSNMRNYPITNEDIENMTDEIYYALEEKNEIQLNINLTNRVRTTSQSNITNTKVSEKRPEVRTEIRAKENRGENRETRQINRGLRDIIKILLIRELLNRPGRPPMPHPPMPGPRPPMRPSFGEGPRRIPFNSEFENLNHDIFEN